MTVLVVGSMAIDSVETPTDKRPEALGGSATFFSTCASKFTDVQLVAVVGDDFPEEHIEMLKERKVDLAGLERAKGKTFFWAGRYGANPNERETLDTQLGVFANFKPKLPAHFRETDYVFLANIHPTLQADVLEQVTSPKLVAMDTMNFWIEGERAALTQVLKKVDLLLVNETEARLLSEEHNLYKAARTIRGMGPSKLVIKLGEFGALYLDEDQVFFVPAFPLESVFDPTGAGDTFAGGMMGLLSRFDSTATTSIRQAMVMGCVMGSFAVESFSVDRLKTVTLDEIRQRFDKFRQLTAFEPVDL